MVSLRENILDDIETTLLTIDGTGDFNFNINGRVYRSTESGGQITETPIIFIQEPTENRLPLSLGPNGKYQVTMSLPLLAYLQEGIETSSDKLSASLDDLSSDIIRAIMTDQTRGGNASGTLVVNHETGVSEKNPQRGVITMTIQVLYFHRTNNPESS
jgi:hypothetical protein